MSKKKIKTINGDYFFDEKNLQWGGPKINKTVSKQNLLRFREVLNANHLEFSLIFGTLLGAVREGSFIDHDEDVDVFIKYDDLDHLKSILFILREKGLNVVRFTGELLSLERKNNYIDIYLFRQNKNNSWHCMGYEFPEVFFLNTKQIRFLGCEFSCPNKKYEFLKICYGSDWETPIVGKHAFATKHKWIRDNIAPLLPTPVKKFLKALSLYIQGY